MPDTAADPPLTPSFDRALELAHRYHRTQLRKGTGIPYVAHLLQVAGLVLEAGGTEAQAIAGLLHDAIEDADTVREAREREREIGASFGEDVLRMVRGCTDGDPGEKDELPWRERKRRYLEHLREADPDTLLVSICDKVHNARAILRDLREAGPSLWDRFNAGKGGSLWYYRALVDAYASHGSIPYLDDFRQLVAAIERESERGSRRHLLDWVESPRFVPRLNRLLSDTGAAVTDADVWRPTGWRDPAEAKLHEWGPEVLGDAVAWDELASWWLAHLKGANVPNWDLAATCGIDGGKGLVLVEAKAHDRELKNAGKGAPDPGSEKSAENHERIGRAIDQAREALRGEVPSIAISRDRHYQLSNRVAHAWWLASRGLSVVLVYLGFLNADDVADLGEPFDSDEHWRQVFRAHAAAVFPEGAMERWIPCGRGRFMVAVRSVAAGH